RGHGVRRRDRDGTRLRRGAHEHRGREGTESGADGAGDEKSGRSRAGCLPRRAHAEKTLLRQPQLAGFGPDPAEGHVATYFLPEHRRQIRSFVLRQGRVSKAQLRHHAGLLPVVHLLVPDPCPKKRHHKRRLIQPAFVALLASRMKPGACVHTCTDWEEYARQMLEVLSAEPALRNTASGYASRPEARPETKFERRGLALGHRVWDLVF